ncbi:Rqc2 family fibronectin-binding protein [Risungbinella massiliensis]|uniref:Rqc2 family fibronectin-binding protein n=1 Tax=Risungbinella massiliensis TaxID=1329796 RepID=UPI0005CC05DD|nr:NFACT RNA binding domain-containing protein [Risungbinella massiliensis]
MSFDGTMVRAVVHELKEKLTGGRISKIYQPTNYELLLTIRAKGQNQKLLLSAHPANARLQLTKWNPEHPKEPPMFCMYLRKHLEGGIIREIRQIEMERITLFQIQTRNELGDDVTRQLIVETMGRHSNIILIDTESQKILDSIHRIPYAISQVRQVLPGLNYQFPPSQEKRSPLDVTEEQFIAGFDYNQGKLDRQLMNRYTGIGPVIAREIIARAGVGDRAKLWAAFAPFQQQLQENQYQPTLVDTGEKLVFAITTLTSVKGEVSSFDFVSQLLDKIYLGKAERERNRQFTKELTKRLQNEIEKNKKKVLVLQEELEEGKTADRFQQYGELLTAYSYQIPAGSTETTVINYYDAEGTELTIPLDPKKSVLENAQSYFLRYKKAKAARKWNKEQITIALEENQYLETLLVQLGQASLAELEQIQDELVEEGLLKPMAKKGPKRKQTLPLPSSYTATDGTTILVGKNNKQNDYLTHRMAHSQDMWLHTKEIPGSHVVIRQYNGSEETLREAATLAAYFSKARLSSQVPVDYTYIKHVKKPSGAKPGFVIYTHQQTLYVTPSEEAIEHLEQRTTKVK